MVKIKLQITTIFWFRRYLNWAWEIVSKMSTWYQWNSWDLVKTNSTLQLNQQIIDIMTDNFMIIFHKFTTYYLKICNRLHNAMHYIGNKLESKPRMTHFTLRIMHIIYALSCFIVVKYRLIYPRIISMGQCKKAIALAMELYLSCTDPSILYIYMQSTYHPSVSKATL